MHERRLHGPGARRLLRTAALGLIIAACGSRTGLLLPGDGFVDDDGGSADGSSRDGNFPGFDGTPPDFDGSMELDALPPIDGSRPDVPLPNDCPDADATLVYVLSDTFVLYSFFPPTLGFKTIGKIVCPSAGSTPYSMAVDRKGKAYSVFDNGALFQISTATAACAGTGYPASQLGWKTFGMGFSGDNTSESLFVAEGNQSTIPNPPPSQGLAILDTTTLKLTKVGPFSVPLSRCELTGTGDGRLFAFCIQQAGDGSVIAQIDPKNANVVAQNRLKIGHQGDAFAYAFWGGSFWIFTSSNGGGTTVVTQYDLDTGVEQNVTTLADTIVGAGVSTCAPR